MRDSSTMITRAYCARSGTWISNSFSTASTHARFIAGAAR